MKKNVLFFMLILAAGFVSAQQIVTLDASIADAARTIDGRLNSGIKIVILNFNSPSERLSNYVIDELTGAVVNSGKLIVVDRQNLTLIQQEMDFQMSGEVSDVSAQEIGKKLGAESIISGSIEDMNTFYRVRFRVIEVVTAAIQTQVSANVRKDNIITNLLGSSGFSDVGNGTAASFTGYPNGLNYSTGRKTGAGFLNWIYGIGSFTMGDWVGGLIVGGTELAGLLLVMTAGIEDDGSVGGGYYLGLGLQLGGVIYGHIRPFQYDRALAAKNGTYYAYSREPWKDNPLEHIDIAVLPTRNGSGIGGAMHLSYSLQF
jgi:TolB-like protein